MTHEEQAIVTFTQIENECDAALNAVLPPVDRKAYERIREMAREGACQVRGLFVQAHNSAVGRMMNAIEATFVKYLREAVKPL